MKWKNAVRDGLPDKSIDLVISYKGVYHTAFYRKDEQSFEITGESGKVLLPGNNELIYWVVTSEEKKIRRDVFRILIADDDTDDHVFMKAGLEECRVKVEIDSVYDGEQAIDYLLKKNVYKNIAHLPDLVLLDINMPRKDGFEVLREMLRHEKLRHIAVYVITTSRDIDHLGQALELGARGFFSKGASRGEMIRVMKEVCSECFEAQAVQ